MSYALWNPVTTYQINDVVDYNAVLYVSLQNINLNNIPSATPLFWAVLGSGGGGGGTSICVRDNNTLTYNIPAGLLGIGYSPKTIFTIPLALAYSECNVYTLYIRSITGQIQTASGVPVSFQIYVSDQLGGIGSGAYDPTEGAITQYAFNNLNNFDTFTAVNLVWNWRPSSISSNVYINAFLTSPTSTLAFSSLQIVFDLIGQSATLV